MITVNKANPTPGEITSSLTGSTGDGAGLHFDGAAGSVAFTPVNLGTDFSFEFVIKQDSTQTHILSILAEAVLTDLSSGATATNCKCTQAVAGTLSELRR